MKLHFLWSQTHTHEVVHSRQYYTIVPGSPIKRLSKIALRQTIVNDCAAMTSSQKLLCIFSMMLLFVVYSATAKESKFIAEVYEGELYEGEYPFAEKRT